MYLCVGGSTLWTNACQTAGPIFKIGTVLDQVMNKKLGYFFPYQNRISGLNRKFIRCELNTGSISPKIGTIVDQVVNNKLGYFLSGPEPDFRPELEVYSLFFYCPDLPWSRHNGGSGREQQARLLFFRTETGFPVWTGSLFFVN